ncbi:MAG TPA: DUF262 domain-containing protein [Microthrixaceae bacterium]|nr:DUF262 domain-containing protein [Microthrixaceae bacterium]HMT24438.1 DUF262 domain-containing protein [Microthrixaceae bacterium]HMT60869.1 DUF262 domain-containing protein [Microthrixaceae bacterium]
MLADLRGRINTDAEYQRGEVWSEPQQKLLIDSILRGFDLPKIFLRKLPDGASHLFDVVDGVQRLTAIWRFLDDEYPLPRSYSYPDLGLVGGKKWSELPQDAKDRLQFSKVTVTELETEDEGEIRELFQRLQQGEPLNSAERRNAMDVPVRNFVANVLAKHALWPETGIKSKRFGWHEMSAILLAIVNAGGPTGLKGADLLALYEDTEFDPNGPAAEQAIKLLNQLKEIAATSRGAIRTRWGLVDLAIALMRANADALEVAPDDAMQLFLAFEEERRSGSVALSDLRSSVVGLTTAEADAEEQLELPEIEPDMLLYLNAFAREGATKDNVAIRAEVLFARLRAFLQAS